MTAIDAYADLIFRSKEATTLGSCAALLGWDERVNMPRNGSAYRGEQMAMLARMGHDMATAPAIGEALTAVEGSDLVADANTDAAVNAREFRRNYDRAVKLPKQLVEELGAHHDPRSAGLAGSATGKRLFRLFALAGKNCSLEAGRSPGGRLSTASL